MAWRPPPEPVRPHVHTQQWQRPDSSGDAFITVTLPREGFVAVALDVAGHGAELVPKVTYLEGWLRGWTHGLSVIPRIESFAEDLNAELRRAELDAAWFAAIVSFQRASPNLVAYQGMARRFPAPLLLIGAPPSTLPAVGRGEAPVRHDLWPPWRLAVASDGLLRRLGRGDEQRGKMSLLEWQIGVERDCVPDAQLSTKQPLADDELYADITWQPWDGVQRLDVHDDAQRHRLKRKLRQEIGLGPVAGDELCVAAGEALKNVMKHAGDAHTKPVTVLWRDEGACARIEVKDGGTGSPPFREHGGLAIMRAHADGVDVRRRYPQGTVVSLIKRKDEPDDKP